MKFPDNYLWGYPGFPSIMVSYLKTNDFFYSGHCGLPIVLLCEFNHLGMKLMQAFCIFTFIFEPSGSQNVRCQSSNIYTL